MRVEIDGKAGVSNPTHRTGPACRGKGKRERGTVVRTAGSTPAAPRSGKLKEDAMKNMVTVKVLANYNGCTGQVVETITRKGIRRRPLEGNQFTLVSYKGKLRKVFGLPQCYGDLAGLCITVK